MDLSYTVGSILLSSIAEHKNYAFMYRFSTIFIVLLLVIYSYSLIRNNTNRTEDLEEKAS